MYASSIVPWFLSTTNRILQLSTIFLISQQKKTCSCSSVNSEYQSKISMQIHLCCISCLHDSMKGDTLQNENED